jgi:hypothetical protein
MGDRSMKRTVRQLTLVAGLFLAVGLPNRAAAHQGPISEGLTRISDGRNLDGWHISRTTHHGASGSDVVKGGDC